VPPTTAKLVHLFFDALDRHDEQALLDVVHPDVEFTSLIVEVEGGFHGHEGVRAYLRELFGTFPNLRIAVDEVREVGNGGLVRVRVHASGVASGVSTDLTDWQALSVRDARIAWWAFFRTEAEALAAAEERSRLG
jgi:ketosteroid isomerase-like protein